MSKKVLSICIATIMMLSSIICVPFSAMADAEITSGNYKYTIQDGKALITDYVGTETDVTIPSTLDGLTVTEISEFSKLPNNTAKTVTLPETVVKIGNGAFCNAYAIETFNTGDGLKMIYPEAFYDCHKLSKVNFGKNVAEIYAYVFVGCPNLKSVTLPKSVTHVGELAFPKTTKINCYSSSKDALEFIVDNDNKYSILDKKTSIKNVAKAKKSFKISWKKVSSMSGYQISYSTSKKFTSKTTKTIYVSGTKTTAKTIKNLKSKKTYYVRIRAYKTVKTDENAKGKKLYGSWSSVKTVKTK